jgi:hypothetical protein
MKTRILGYDGGRNSSDERGATLVVALVFSAGISIALAGYLSLGRTTLKLAHRSYYQNVAMNLAETGLERGMRAVQMHKKGAADAWTNPWAWEAGGGAWKLVADDAANYEGNAKGALRVVVQNVGTTEPVILARSRVQLHEGSPVEKWLMITTSKTSKFDIGLVGDYVTFNGIGARANSYDSSLGDYDASLNHGANVTVAALGVTASSMSVGNATIEGNVATATGEGEKGIAVGPRGNVTGSVTYDFTRDYQVEPEPGLVEFAAGALTGSHVLGDTGGTPGKHFGKDALFYKYESITVGAKETLSVKENTIVVVTLTKTGGTALKVFGTDAIIRIPSTSTLAFYIEGDVDILGSGVANEGRPMQFQIWGTLPEPSDKPQDFKIAGNGDFSGIIYAPNADVSLNGGGKDTDDVKGAVIGKKITINGSGEFHYDESLAKMDFGDAYRLKAWSELTKAEERAAYSEVLAF